MLCYQHTTQQRVFVFLLQFVKCTCIKWQVTILTTDASYHLTVLFIFFSYIIILEHRNSHFTTLLKCYTNKNNREPNRCCRWVVCCTCYNLEYGFSNRTHRKHNYVILTASFFTGSTVLILFIFHIPFDTI